MKKLDKVEEDFINAFLANYPGYRKHIHYVSVKATARKVYLSVWADINSHKEAKEYINKQRPFLCEFNIKVMEKYNGS